MRLIHIIRSIIKGTEHLKTMNPGVVCHPHSVTLPPEQVMQSIHDNPGVVCRPHSVTLPHEQVMQAIHDNPGVVCHPHSVTLPPEQVMQSIHDNITEDDLLAEVQAALQQEAYRPDVEAAQKAAAAGHKA